MKDSCTEASFLYDDNEKLIGRKMPTDPPIILDSLGALRTSVLASALQGSLWQRAQEALKAGKPMYFGIEMSKETFMDRMEELCLRK